MLRDAMKVTALRGGFDNIGGPFPSAGGSKTFAPIRVAQAERCTFPALVIDPVSHVHVAAPDGDNLTRKPVC